MVIRKPEVAECLAITQMPAVHIIKSLVHRTCHRVDDILTAGALLGRAMSGGAAHQQQGGAPTDGCSTAHAENSHEVTGTDNEDDGPNSGAAGYVQQGAAGLLLKWGPAFAQKMAVQYNMARQARIERMKRLVSLPVAPTEPPLGSLEPHERAVVVMHRCLDVLDLFTLVRVSTLATSQPW